MTFDEERDNTTDIENQIIEADKRAREESAPYPPAYPFPVFGRPGDDPVEDFELSEIPENGVRSVDLFDGKGRKLFSFSVSTNGVAYQVLQAGEDADLFTTQEDEV